MSTRDFAYVTGALSLSVGSIADACTAPANGGKRVRVDVRVDGVFVGHVWYAHLVPTVSVGQSLSNGQKIGDLASGLPSNSACWTGPHLHIEPYNAQDYPNATYDYSCLVPRAVGTAVSASSHLGVLGGGYASTFDQPCPAGATTPTIATAPSAPGTPSCSVDNAGAVTASWAAASANGSAILRYENRHKNMNTGSVSGWSSNGLSRSRTYGSLSLGTGYQFQARAVNTIGNGPASAYSCTCTPRKPPAFPAVSGPSSTQTAIVVSWNAAAPNGAAITNYRVGWETQGGAQSGTVLVGSASLSTVFTPSNPAAPYRFRVQAQNAAGWGSYSSWTSFVVLDPGPTIVPGASGIAEGSISGTAVLHLPVTLDAPSTKTVSVDWATVNTGVIGHASSPDDYVAANGTLTFAPGDTEEFIDITVKADTLDEEDWEWIVVTTSNPVNATIGGFYGLALGIIVDDDPPPQVVPSVGSVVEGNSGQTTLSIPVTLSEPSGRVVTVDWQTDDHSATAPSDYQPASGTLTFQPGETEQFADVTVNGDYEVEPDEFMIITTSNPTNATIGGYYGIGFGIILDDGDTGATTPAAPTGATATSGTNGAVPISWTAPTDTGGPAIDHYEIRMVGTSTTRTATSSPYTWTGLTNGTSYRFEVRACNIVGCGPWSAQTNAATPYTKPGTVSKPSVSSVNNGIAVSWSAPSSGGSTIIRYDLQYGSTTINNGTSRSRTVNFGQDGSARTFRVRACNAAGCGSWSSYSSSLRPKTIQVSRGAAATYGYWYNTTVTGPAGWATTLKCNDGAGLGWWTPECHPEQQRHLHRHHAVLLR